MSGLLIMGSGVVGNFAAAYFRRYFPTLRVTVVGRSDQELPIVGESLVEISTRFLQDLGLSRTLIEEHLPKYGLTYYYKLDPSRPRDPDYIVDEAPSNPPFPSFLINRFSFDAELRRLNRQKGVRYIEGRVTGVSLGGDAPHRVTVQRADGKDESLEARWLVDATRRRRLLARQLGLQSRAPHQRSAFWFRLVDFDPSILERIHAFKKVNRSYAPYYCTHHFFGKGNWVWLIPVRSQDSRRMISIGLTYRPDLFPGEVTTTREFMDWMAGEHPLVGDFVKSGEIVDTNAYRNYMYRAKRRYSSQGWFLVGDAADTVDPLYSTGLALASLSIQQVGAMVRRDLEGRLSEA
ncbi:MAG: tryptophan 7-halogenase, partial [Acidobacteria bacterium]|nr:tryptophan 7-halogenase [Acidobacteriota bacterium]